MTNTANARKAARAKGVTNGKADSCILREEPQDYGFPSPLFIDLFCGIGGFRIAFERAGGQCVFSSDYDKFSQQTYEANFGARY